MLKKIKAAILEKFGARLATQLIVSFLGIFFLIIAISSIFVYTEIVNILEKNSEKNSIRQFNQYEYNIKTFCSEVDLISRQLIIDANLQNIITYRSLSDIERVTHAEEAFRYFSQIMGNFKYIDSIVFYGGDGLILKASLLQNEILFDETSKKDWFYNSDVFRVAEENRAKLVWFGGYSDLDYKIDIKSKTDKDTDADKAIQSGLQSKVHPQYYMSAARTISSGSRVGVLIINVDEGYFTSIYNNSKDTEAGDMYITDRSGEIISHSDKARIGEQSASYRQMDFKNGMVNFFSTSQDRQKQVICHDMGFSGWILVNEVPIRIILKDINNLRIVMLAMFFVGFILAIVLSRYLIFRLTRPLNELTKAMKRMEKGEVDHILDLNSKNEIGLLVRQFNKMSKSIHEYILQTEVIQNEKRRIEIEALQSQINPHFLYNTINTIKWMGVMIKADNIVESLTVLGDILHPIFKKHDILCPINEEIEYVKNYIRIMNYRFAEAFEVSIYLPDELPDYQILRFILQPLVENAVYHGLMNLNGGKITIAVLEQEGNIVIEVSDNGEGMDEARLAEINNSLLTGVDSDIHGESRVGLVNVNRRIQLHFGKQYGIGIQSKKNSGTKITLTIPEVRKS